ncbi:hypothetical protein [Hyphococcus lacteus]|uniref:Uncharacterized protein n=1 Tax=Hyphococcus lacteus TaxID=3143536 RepID=A0ABV3Z0V4_9PROT
MNKFIKTIGIAAVGIATLGMTSAMAARPDHCRHDHDHRSHASNYYDYYSADRYYRAGAYQRSGQNSGLSISIRVGDDRYNDGNYYRDRNYNNRRGYNQRQRRVVNREVFGTRYNARIVLTEKIVRSRHGRQLICTVDARGRQAHRVPHKRLRKVARRNCSKRAQIRILA